MGAGELNAGANPSMDLHPIQGGVEILLVTSCYRNRGKVCSDEPLGSYADSYSLLLPKRYFSTKKNKKKNIAFCREHLTLDQYHNSRPSKRYDEYPGNPTLSSPDREVFLKPDLSPHS